MWNQTLRCSITLSSIWTCWPFTFWDIVCLSKSSNCILTISKSCICCVSLIFFKKPSHFNHELNNVELNNVETHALLFPTFPSLHLILQSGGSPKCSVHLLLLWTLCQILETTVAPRVGEFVHLWSRACQTWTSSASLPGRHSLLAGLRNRLAGPLSLIQGAPPARGHHRLSVSHAAAAFMPLPINSTAAR